MSAFSLGEINSHFFLTLMWFWSISVIVLTRIRFYNPPPLTYTCMYPLIQAVLIWAWSCGPVAVRGSVEQFWTEPMVTAESSVTSTDGNKEWWRKQKHNTDGVGPTGWEEGQRKPMRTVSFTPHPQPPKADRTGSGRPKALMKFLAVKTTASGVSR